MTPRRYRPSHRNAGTSGPLIAFLLIASFGILFAGCSGKPIKGPLDIDGTDDFTFTEEDVARFRKLAEEPSQGEDTTNKGSGTVLDFANAVPLAGSGGNVVLDISKVAAFNAVRSGPAAGGNVYRVTNEFLNVRSAPAITVASLERLDQGAIVTVLELLNAAWAKVEYAPSKQGFVALRYLSKLVSEEKLAEEKKAFDGTYFVNFGFVNVRKEPNAQSEKLGEIPGQTFVRPISKDDVWARVPFQGKEGYVAMQYLSPFVPNFLIRQDSFTLPVLHMSLSQKEGITMLQKHLEYVRKEGVRVMTVRDFGDLLLAQEQRDVRLDPKSAIFAVSDVTPENVRALSEVLGSSGMRITIFLETRYIGIDGITEKMMLTLLANGADIQSAAHSGDDLRALTNAQIDLELRQSRKMIEDITKRPVTAIAYPQGGVNDRVMQKTAEAGYLLGLSSSPERTFTRAQLLRLPSFAIATMVEEDVLKLVKP